MRDEDTVARLGGDEFAVLLPRVESSDVANVVADKLYASLQEPFLRRRPAAVHHVEHRHRHRPGRRRSLRNVAQARRHRDVPGQAAGPEPIRHLQPLAAREPVPPAPPRRRPARRARERPVAGVVPTSGGAGDGPHGRGRGPRALAAPGARAARSRRVRLPGRGNRPHRRDRRMGAARGVPAGAPLAGDGPAGAAGRGQPVDPRSARCVARRHRGRGVGREPARRSPAATRGHRAGGRDGLRPGARRDGAAQGARREPRHRRLRYRQLGAEPTAQLSRSTR